MAMNIHVLFAGCLLLGSLYIVFKSAKICNCIDHDPRRTDITILLAGVWLFLTLLEWLITGQWNHQGDVRALGYGALVAMFEIAFITILVRDSKALNGDYYKPPEG